MSVVPVTSRTRRCWLAGIAVLSLLAGQATARPRWISATFVDVDTATTMGISWVDAPTAGTTVEYGPAPDALTSRTSAVLLEAEGVGVFRNAVLTGLAPASEYFYRVGGPAGWSAVHRFRTSPQSPEAPVRFAVLGDGRSSSVGPSQYFGAIYDEVLAEDPAFVLDSGDLVMRGTEPANWRAWFAAMDGRLASVPHMSTIGNHDKGPGWGEGANYNKVFHYPRNTDTGTEDYYYFTYGPVAVAVLSSATFPTGQPLYSRQAAWLDRMLATHPRPWTVVVLHHPICVSDSLASHAANENRQNGALVPVLDRHGVDVVFQGHVHWYERIGPARARSDDPRPLPVAPPATGTVYVTTGGTGGDWMLVPCWTAPVKYPGHRTCADERHYVVVDVDGDRITIRAQRTTAGGRGPAVLDEVSWTKAGLAAPGGSGEEQERP